MKAIYFCENSADWERVYCPAVKENLSKEFLIEDKLYQKADLGKADFSDVEILFSTWGIATLSEEEIAKYFPSLKGVFYAAGSVQAFARQYLNKGIRVFSAWKANAVPVVEYAVAQIVLANKGFYQTAQRTKAGYQEGAEFFHNYKGNYDAKVGILGDGAIGAEVIKRLKEMHLELYVYSITMTKEQANSLGVRLVSLDEIFEECDVISNHLANNEKTQGIINKALLSKLKDYSTFINTGRGAQVDEEALIEILQKNPTITAVLDVTYPEPPEDGSQLYTLPNVILTPHIAGSAGLEVRRMAEKILEESMTLKKGDWCLYEVKHEMINTIGLL